MTQTNALNFQKIGSVLRNIKHDYHQIRAQRQPECYTALGRGTAPENHQVDPCFPAPQQLSGQKSGEDWKTFFMRHHEENRKKEEKESPSQWQLRESRERVAKNHSLPGKSRLGPIHPFLQLLLCVCLSEALLCFGFGHLLPRAFAFEGLTAVLVSFSHFGGFSPVSAVLLLVPECTVPTVFEWQPQDKFEGFLLRIHLTKAEDLCDQLDPTSTPDGNWEEDQFNFPDPIPDPVPPPPPVPPSLSSFLQDICTYFGCHEVAASSDYTEGIEHFITHLRFHLGISCHEASAKSIGCCVHCSWSMTDVHNVIHQYSIPPASVRRA
ncbi:hypothetical protein C8R48DRAFT_781528 [Suillus tomentosus]|nr:hypothetical protein C8R48DRAFT_782264 [Suillus tomentosus]KAG1841076.1 hypothetical protein C8R48DRAFT_781528 [Suillus tomentosus]